MTSAGGARAGPAASLLALAATVVGSHALLFPRLADLDGFYHVGHAARYLEAGPLDTSFPWATQSIIGDLGADLWWGFHVLLMPFAALGDPAVASRVAALALTTVLALTMLGVLRRAGAPGAAWWAALGLVAVPNVLFRWLMVRPHVLSLAAAVLLLEALCRGRRWHAAGAAAALTWIHLGLFWMPVGVVGAWLLARGILGMAGWGRAAADGKQGDASRARLGWAAAAIDAGAVLAGAALGWLLRPEPLAAARLARVQILELFAAKGTDQPLGFAGELQPLPFLELVRTSWFFLVVWAAAVVLVVRAARRPVTATMDDRAGADPTAVTPHPAPPAHRPLLATAALLCSTAFLLLALASSRRALVEWVGFGALAAALVAPTLAGRTRRWATWVGGALLLLHLPWAAHRHALNARLVAFPPDLLRGAATWLAVYSDPGDVVFHARWDNFGPLFARNRHNRYLSGMDPIFFHRRDPGRYWEFFFLSSDLITDYTCDAFPCSTGTATGTHEAIRDHFGARWVVVEPQRNPNLAAWLRSADGFRLAVDTGREVVFEVMP